MEIKLNNPPICKASPEENGTGQYPVWINQKPRKWVFRACLRILEVWTENGCGKWHFLVWNRVRIWRTGQHTPPRIPRCTPGPFSFIHRLGSSPQQGRARFSRHFFATLALCTVQLTGDFKPLTQCFMHLKAGNQTQGATHTRTLKRNWHVCAVLGIHSLSIQIRSIQVLFLLFSNTRLKPLENICQERGRKPTRLKAYLRPSISARSLNMW